MKLLFVIHALSGGGAERILVQLANYFSVQGHEVSVIIFSEKEPFYKLHESIELLRIINKKTNRNIFENIRLQFITINSLKKIFINQQPDIIISFLTEMNIICTISALLAKKNIVVSEHTNYNVKAKGILGFLRRIVYPKADAVIVLTNYDKKKYSFLNNVHVIHNPLILSNQFVDIKRKKVILGVGRLVELKGFDRLIEAFSRLSAINWDLTILGEGPKRKELEDLVEKLNIKNRVSLPGASKEIEKYYKLASIFVLSSKIEGFPNVLCEAMGYGCPSIAFNCLTGPSDIIENNVTGILVEADNIGKLTHELQSLIDNVDKRLLLGENSQKITEWLDIKIIAEQWSDVFKNIKQGN